MTIVNSLFNWFTLQLHDNSPRLKSLFIYHNMVSDTHNIGTSTFAQIELAHTGVVHSMSDSLCAHVLNAQPLHEQPSCELLPFEHSGHYNIMLPHTPWLFYLFAYTFWGYLLPPFITMTSVLFQ